MNTLELRTEQRSKIDNVEEFYVDGFRLADRVGADYYVSPLGWLDVHPDRDFRGMIELNSLSDLPSGRVPLFVCPECAAYDCGLVTAKIERVGESILWSDFRWERDYDEWTVLTEVADLRLIFDSKMYANALQLKEKGEQD